MKQALVVIMFGEEEEIDSIKDSFSIGVDHQIHKETYPYPDREGDEAIIWEGAQELVSKKGSGDNLTDKEISLFKNYLKTKVRTGFDLVTIPILEKDLQRRRERLYQLHGQVDQAAQFLLGDEVPKEWEEFIEKTKKYLNSQMVKYDGN